MYNLKLTIKFFALFFTLYIVNFTLVPPVYAHVLKTDGSIGAVMHIDPDDDPIAQSQASFFFEFKDKQDKFQPQNCDCNFSIVEQGKEIYSQPLFQNNPSPSLTSASIFFTFPGRDVYQIKVTGNPNSSGDFQPFTLIYDVRVDRQADTQAANQTSSSQPNTNWFISHLPHILALVIILGFLVFAIVYKKNNKSKV